VLTLLTKYSQKVSCGFQQHLHIGQAKNYYQLLELSNTNPTEKELKKAFRDASKKYHPDKNPGIDTTEIFIEVK
jgi:preprotein translocase subunit Sec63